MITLRIEEIAADKGLTLDELSNLSGVALDEIQGYTTIETLTDEISANLRKIAAKLNVPVVELIKPVNKQVAFKLNILEMAKKKGITFEELTERTGIHPAILAFYSTQTICKNKLAETQCKKNIHKISETLDCCTEELQVVGNLPTTMLRIEEVAKERNITLKDLELLSELPSEFIDLITTQPVDIDDVEIWETFKKNFWCDTLGICKQALTENRH